MVSTSLMIGQVEGEESKKEKRGRQMGTKKDNP